MQEQLSLGAINYIAISVNTQRTRSFHYNPLLP